MFGGDDQIAFVLDDGDVADVDWTGSCPATGGPSAGRRADC